MRSSRPFIVASLGAVSAFLIWLQQRPVAPKSTGISASADSASAGTSTLARLTATAAPNPTALASTRPAPPAEPQLAPPVDQRWSEPVAEKAFARFAEWTSRYLAESSDVARASLEAEGVALASRRREKLGDLIQSNPQRALELAVPHAVRKQLPETVAGQLEERLDGKGDLTVLAALAEPGHEAEVTPVSRKVTLGDREFQAFVFGRFEGEPTRFNIPLHGIAVERLMAVEENPVRLLEAAEATELAAKNPDPVCAISGQPAASFGEATAVDTGGERKFLCGTGHAEQLNSQLIRAASGGGSVDENGDIHPLSTYTEGIKRLLLIRVDFKDLPGAPFSDATGTNLVKGLNDFYTTSSYGRTGFQPIGKGSTVTRTFRMPKTAAVYGASDAGILRTDARNAAQAAGINLNSYDFDLTCFGAVPGFGWAGLGYVGGPGAWIRAAFGDAGVMAHEVGHNYGLNHANFWDTTDGSTLGKGASVEYGDGYDTMGNATAGKRHFNASYKNYLNWLPGSGVQIITTSGQYRLFPHDATNTTGIRALRVAKNSKTNYWIEFRQRFTDNAWAMNGVTLRWGRGGNTSSLLLDTTPGSADGKNDAGIVVGRTFSDPSAGIHITPIAKNAGTPPSIDVVVNKGSFAGNQAPSVSVGANATSVSLNFTVSFTATASDPEGDALAYYWDFGDGTFGSNAATASKRWTTAGDYVVRCTVTDMKGGTSSDSVIVRAGAVSTFRLSGKVMKDGQPLAGVRVFTSNTKQTFTDPDGTYTLVGLARGSYTVRAEAPGLIFTRDGFTNPLNVTANVAGIDFEGAPPTDFENVTLIPAGAEWRYLDNGSNQGTAWRSAAFDDHTWNKGAAQLGYGDDDVTTVLNFGPDSANKYITTYLRHAFAVSHPASFLALNLGVVRDDGVVLYLNGKEVFRSNMPSGTIGYLTRASTTVGGADESTYYETELSPASFVDGDNVLAAELHQAAPDSSDLSFNLYLNGLRPPVPVSPEIATEASTDGLKLSWADASGVFVLQTSVELGANASWQPAGLSTTSEGGIVTATIPPTDAIRFYRLFKP